VNELEIEPGALFCFSAACLNRVAAGGTVDINPERMPKPESMFEVKAKVIRDDEGDIFATLYCHPRRGYVVIAERSGRILTLARIGDELEG
jgi:hypothetical protein